MPRVRSPRKGSLQFWPRKRAKKAYASIRSWPNNIEGTKLLGFAGYKAGMAHLGYLDTSNALTKNEVISTAVTIIECPPIKPLAIRFYKKTLHGLKVVSDLFNKDISKEVKRRLQVSSKSNKPEDFDEIRLVVYAQPKLTGIGKKKPEILELAISGEREKKLEFALGLFNKEINVNDVFKDGQFIDVHSVSKGKGFQGTVKRFGVVIRQHKSEKTKRGIGTLGPWTPKKVSFRVPQPGKMGYHLRTEYNKWIMKVGEKSKEINPKGGFGNYGQVKNNYLIIKGTVPGARKRLVIMTEQVRVKKMTQIPQIRYVSPGSKQ